MPGSEAYCNDCVPRGCSCNIDDIKYYNKENVPEKSKVIFWNKDVTEWTKEIDDNTFFFEIVDENYRREPCCEYCWSEDGFEIEEENGTEKEND